MSVMLDAALMMLEPGSVAELRIPKTKKRTVSGYFDDFGKLAAAASEWDSKAPGVYVTLNPVNPDLLARSVNHLTEWADTTTDDASVLRRRWLPIDCDPVRSSGISSTEEEHDAAIARARDIGQWLGKQGWQRPVWADSGNGGHLLYRIDLPNDSESTDLIRRCLEALDLRFSDDAVTVDVTNYNPARIWKMYGTTAAKGDSTQERPHRVSKVLSAPPEVETVDVALLRKLAGAAPQRSTPARGGEEFDVEAFMAANNLLVKRTAPWQGGTKWVLETCPWNPEHTNDSAVILRLPGGALAAMCQHNGCTGNDWAALRSLYEPEYGQRRDGASAAKEIATPEPPSETEDGPQNYPVLVRLSDVTPRQVQWLWPGRIPLGKISIIAGDPGLMKSMLSLDIAARVSRGLPWPDGGTAPMGNVVLLTAEDDLDDTVRPRLDTLGADVDRITALTMIWTPEGEKAFNLREHLPMLEKAITPETRLVIIDPVLAFTGGTDTHVSAQVRGVLAPLAKLAQETQVSVTGIIHLNKKIAGNAFQRILASIDFSAAPRSVLLVGEDADDPTLRHFAVVKNNLAAPAETLTYRWSDGQGFTWAGKSDLTAHQLLAAPADGEGRAALIEAKEILEDLLSGGPVAPTKIRKAASAAGVKEATLRGAKDALGVRSVKFGFGEDGEWKWELPALRRGENTDPTLDGSDTKHQEPSPALGEQPRLSKSPDDGPDSCLTCGAEATYYAPNGKPFCDEHRLDRSWEKS